MTISRFYNARIVDPSQSIDVIGYIDVFDCKISDLQQGTPAKNDTVDILTDCNGAVLAPGLGTQHQLPDRCLDPDRLTIPTLEQ